MIKSANKILTTHAGSLPRGPALAALLVDEEQGKAIDQARMKAEVETRVGHVLQMQEEVGIDIANDGEQPRVGFQTYIGQRMEGFGGASQRNLPADFIAWPEYAARVMRRMMENSAKITNAPQAVSDIRYKDLSSAQNECDVMNRLCQGKPFAECFMTAASPGIIATTMHNAHYARYEDYVLALAEEMRKEYELIVAKGFVLQIDAPDLAMERTMMFRDKPLNEFLDAVSLHVEAIDRALANIPADRVRLHCCWGNWEGPHTHDVPLSEILPIIYEANVGALSLPFGNPRHQHEYGVLRKFPLPDRVALIAGVIDTTTNYVEHPEVVAERIEKAVAAVGAKERVIAGTDCGFSTFAGYEFSAEEIVWAKLKSLADGAAIATSRL